MTVVARKAFFIKKNKKIGAQNTFWLGQFLKARCIRAQIRF